MIQISPENSLPFQKLLKRKKKRNDFTQLGRQEQCSLKIHATSHGFSQCRSYTDFDIN